LVDELQLFLAPIVLGGRQAPTFVMNGGVESLKEAHRFVLRSATPVGPDLRLVLHRPL
jgi:riboflavin biosynthesis pyrimidine reductase